MSVTMDGNSNLYIADYGNNRIIQLNLTTNQSQILIPYNINGNRNTYVYTPISIKFDQITNTLVIGQQLGYNVVRWSMETSYWQLIGGSANSNLNGTSRTLFNSVCSIDIDDQSNTYVNDCYNQRIQFFQGDGTPGKTIAGVIQATGNTSFLFNQPTAITFDQNNNLYVADSNNFRIQLFQRL
jgi:sugar lactone lactonase YvrE